MIRRRSFSTLTVTVLVFSILACNFGTLSPATTPSGGGLTPSGASSAAPTIGGAPGACANPLYPVVPGATWNYSMTGDVTSDFTRSITDVKADGFTDQDIFSSGVTRTGEWRCDNGALTALQPEAAVSGSVQTQNLNAQFHTTQNSGVTLPANVRPGDTWTQNVTIEGTVPVGGQNADAKNAAAINCTAAASESVTVKAGTFDAVRTDCKVDMQITITMNGVDVPTSLSSTSTAWYAPGVGMVKTVTAVTSGPGSTIELAAYQIP